MTTHPGPVDQARHRRQTRVIIGGIIAFAAVIAVVGSFRSGDAVAGDSSGDEYAARDVCEQFVEDRLVSPSSADFIDTSARHLQGSSSEWMVTGSVDAENRMGAAIRVDYQCQVEHEGGDSYRLIDLQHTER